MTASAYEKEVEAYKKFRDDRLIPEHKRFLVQIENLESEINCYENLMAASISDNKFSLSSDCLEINTNETYTKIPLDLGSGYSVDFEVFDRDHILTSVGFGFYCQMTWTEAADFCSKRIEMLTRRRFKFKSKLEKMEEHLKVTEEIITQLSKE